LRQAAGRSSDGDGCGGGPGTILTRARAAVEFVRLRLPTSFACRRSGRWLALLAIVLYLSYETGRYRLLTVPLPVVGWALLVSLLGAAWACHGRTIRRRLAVRALAPVTAGLGATCLLALLVVDDPDRAQDDVVHARARPAHGYVVASSTSVDFTTAITALPCRS
jgi:hypothetical protein